MYPCWCAFGSPEGSKHERFRSGRGIDGGPLRGYQCGKARGRVRGMCMTSRTGPFKAEPRATTGSTPPEKQAAAWGMRAIGTRRGARALFAARKQA